MSVFRPAAPAGASVPPSSAMQTSGIEMRITARDARGFSYDFGSYEVDVVLAHEVIGLLSGRKRLEAPADTTFLPAEIAALLRAD